MFFKGAWFSGILLITWIVTFGADQSNATQAQECADLDLDDLCSQMSDDSFAAFDECPTMEEDWIDDRICEVFNRYSDQPTFKAEVNMTLEAEPDDKKVILKCSSQPQSTKTVWYFNERFVESKEELIIENFGEEHTGKYTCSVTTNGGGVKEASLYLEKSGSSRNVKCHTGAGTCSMNSARPCSCTYPAAEELSPPLRHRNDSYEFCQIDFAKEPEDLFVTTGETVRMKCMIEPTRYTATVKWFKDDQNITTRSNAKITRSGLIIPRATAADSGTYKCKVKTGPNCSKIVKAELKVYTSVSEVCGQSSRLNDDSTRAKVGDVPWQGIIRMRDNGIVCGATILNRYWVLTAAHCFKNQSHGAHPHNVVLSFGFTEWGNGELNNLYNKEKQVRQMRRLIVHPRFKYSTRENDLALVKLTRPLVFTKYVRPICLPPIPNTEVKEGLTGTVPYWTHDYLQVENVTITGETMCNREPLNNIFCAGVDGYHHATKGKEGRPFTVFKSDKWYLAGVMAKKKVKAYFSNFADVSKADQWIRNHIGI